MHTPFNRG